MNGIDTLRKKYAALSPEERASMFFTEVTTHQRCVFHRIRPVIPSEGGHGFHGIPATRSR